MAGISSAKKRAGQFAAIAIIVASGAVGLLILWTTNVDPRTDDANVVANFIGIAPEVDGRIISLPIKDNQYVSKGDLLYEIDPQPYEYKLQQAISARDNLDEQIIDERRKIGSQTVSVVIATRGSVGSAETTNSQRSAASAAQAGIPTQEAMVKTAEAQYTLAANNLARAEPLLARRFVTEQQIDQLRTAARSAREDLTRARTTLEEMQARYEQALAQVRESVATQEQQQLRVKQSVLNIDRLETLLSQKLDKAAAVKAAAYDLQRCRVYTPFNARITNLNISVGQYARTGTQVFTLIDTTAWWVLSNYKETQLRHVSPGMPVDIYLMTRPNVRFRGVVESIGFGVSLEDISTGQNGYLPSVTRTLNWVRLAQRFPVRIRVLNPAPDLYRLGASASTIIRSQQGPVAIPADPNVTNIAAYAKPNGNSQPAAH